MADPILINLYIKSLGLNEKAEKQKRKELEKLSDTELNLLISNKGKAEKTETWGLKNLENTSGSYKNNVFPTASTLGTKNYGIELTSHEETVNVPVYSKEEESAMKFLGGLTDEASKNIDAREKEAGVLSSVVNSWKEVFNKKYAKSTVKAEIKDTQDDLEYLKKAASGKITKQSYLTGEITNVPFKDAFKERRGVKFDEKAIADCQEKSEVFARVKTATDMIKQTKSELGFATKGDVTSQMNPEKASESIIKAFKLAGITSKDEINKTLKDIEEKYKNHPDIKKYGGDFRISKNKQGKYVVYRTAKNGFPAEATNEELKIIAKEMSMRLDKAYAEALGTEVPKNATAEDLEVLTQKTFDKYQNEYEQAFSKAYGKKDLKALSEKYVMEQQQGVANIEAGLNIASMALMVVPGGAVASSGWLLKGSVALKASANGSKIVKTLGLIDKSKQFIKGAQTLQKTSQALSPFIMANITLRPTELLEQLTSENGMSAEEWENWGKGVLQNSVYMTLGMGASKIAERAAAMYKTKALVSTLNNAGKSTDEIIAMVKANPVKFPADICKSFKNIDNLAKALQVSSEVALDISSTYLANKAMGNGDLTQQDWFMSVGFALSGGVLQKQFAPLSTDAKIKYLQDAFKEINISKEEARNILKTMDEISAGKKRIKKTNKTTHTEASKANDKPVELTEVVVRPEAPEVKTKAAETPAAQAAATKKIKKNSEQRLKNESEDLEYLEFQKKLNKLREKIEAGEKDNPQLSIDSEDAFFSRLNDVYEKIEPEEFDNAAKLIKNSDIRDYAKLRLDAGELSKGELQLLEDISLGLENLTDTKVKNYINDEIQKCKTADADDITDILDNANKVLDTYHTLNGDYTRLTKQNFIATDIELTTPVEYLQFLRAVYPEKAIEFEQYLSNAQNRIKRSDISRADTNLVKDFLASQKTEALKDLAAYSHDHEMANYLYKEIYLRQEKLPKAVRNKCIEIADKYKSKLFLSAESNNALKEVSLIEEEYHLWAEASQGKSVYPRVLDMHKINTSYIDGDAAYGSTAAGESRMAGPTVYLDGNTEHQIRHALRHELMHQNDGKSLSRIFAKEIKPLMDEIMPTKTITRHNRPYKVLDYDNCKYRDEFLNAGITPKHIRYAYNSREEFLAVAAEGDFKRYSPEFKEVLKKLGMPDFVFELPVTNPKTKRNIDIISEIRSDFPEEKDFNVLAEYFNDELEMISFFSLYKQSESRGNDAGLVPDIKTTDGQSPRTSQTVAVINITQKQAEIKQHLENACKVNGEISIELMQAAEKIQKYGVTPDGAAIIIEKYKDKNGNLNPEIMVLGEKLKDSKLPIIPDMVDVCLNADGKINETIIKECVNLKTQGASIYGIPYLLAASKDANGNFSKEKFDHITNLLIKEDKPPIKLDNVGRILKNCLTDNKLDDTLLNKAIELKNKNIEARTIEKALEASKDGNGKFNEKNYEQVLILINSGIKDYSIADIANVLKQDGIIDETLIKSALKLHQNGVKEFNIAAWFKRAQDKDGNFNPEIFNKLEELSQNPKTISRATWIIGASIDKNGNFNETNFKVIKNLFENTPSHLQKKILTIVQNSVDENNIIVKDYLTASMKLTSKYFDSPSIRLIMQSCKTNNEQVFSYDLFNKVIAATDELTKNSSSPLKTTSLVLEEGKVSLKCEFADSTVKTHRFDKGMNELKAELVETVQKKAGKEPVKITKSNDFEHNFQTKTRRALDTTGTVLNEVNIIKDKNGNVIRTEYLSPSDVAGIYDIRIKTPDGQTKVISSAKVDPETGFTLVEKNMESLDGTVTTYRYEDDPQGNRIIDYKIVDKDGKVLMNDSQTFEVISDNKIISSYNDKVYEITIDGNRLTVEGKTTDEYAEFNLDTFLAEKANKEMLLNLLKQMPGHELINLNQKIKTLSSTDVKTKSIHSAALKQIITADDLSVLLHEAGHTKHSFGTYEVEFNDEFKQIFNEERDAFKKAFPDLQQKYLDYFISEELHSKNFIPRKEGWLQETAAETNSLLNTYYHSPELQIRAQYLQQYFPKTIAKLSEIMKSKELELARPTEKISRTPHAALTAAEYNNALHNMPKEKFLDEFIDFMRETYKKDEAYTISEEDLIEFRKGEDAEFIYNFYNKQPELLVGLLEKDSNGKFLYADTEKYEYLTDILNNNLEKVNTSAGTTMERAKKIYKYLDNPEKYTIKDAVELGLSEKQFKLMESIVKEENFANDRYDRNNLLKLFEIIKDDKDIEFFDKLKTEYDLSSNSAQEILKSAVSNEQKTLANELLSFKSEQNHSLEILRIAHIIKFSEIPEAAERINKLLKMEDKNAALAELGNFSNIAHNFDLIKERNLFAYERFNLNDIKKLTYLNDDNYNEYVIKRNLLDNKELSAENIYQLSMVDDDGYKFYQSVREKNKFSIDDAIYLSRYSDINEKLNKYNLLDIEGITRDEIINFYYMNDKKLEILDKLINECNKPFTEAKKIIIDIYDIEDIAAKCPLEKFKNFDADDYQALRWITSVQIQRLNERPELFEANHINGNDLIELLNISEEHYPRVIRRELLQDKTLTGKTIKALAQLDTDSFNTAVEKDIIHLNCLDERNIKNLIDLDEKVINNLKNITQNPTENFKKRNLNSYDIIHLGVMGPEKRALADRLLYLEKRIQQFTVQEISYLTNYQNSKYIDEIVELAGNPILKAQNKRALSAEEIVTLLQHKHPDEGGIMPVESAGIDYFNGIMDLITHEKRNVVSDRIDVKEGAPIIDLLKSKPDVTNKLIFMEERGSEQFSGNDISRLAAQLTDESFEYYKDFFSNQERKLNNQKQLSGDDLFKIVISLPVENLPAAKELIYIPGRGNRQFNGREITNLAALEPEAFEKIKPYLGETSFLTGHELTEIAEMSSEQFKNFEKYIKLTQNNKSKTMDTLKQVVSFDEHSFENLEKLMNKYPELNPNNAVSIAALADNNYKQAIELLSSGKIPENLVTSIAKLSESEYLKAKNYIAKDVPDYLIIPLSKAQDPQIYEKYNQAIDEAKKKRNQLKTGLQDLQDYEITDFFQNNAAKIINTIDFLGLQNFTHSYTSKFTGLNLLIDSVTNIKNNFTDQEYITLKEKLADKSIEPQDKIGKVKAISAICRNITESERIEFIELIKPNTPSKTQINQAKNIWANPKARFADKFNEFCETFGLDKNDPKIIAFFDKRAQLNPKGYKILNGVKEADIAKLLEIEVVKKQNIKDWNEAIDKKVYETIGVNYTKELSQRLNLTENKYLPEILSSRHEFKNGFGDIVDALIENPDKSIREIFDEMPQNIETKRQYETYGIDYDKWVDTDKNSFKEVKIEASAEKSRQAAIENVEADLNDVAFKTLPKSETDKIFEALEEIGVTYKVNNEPRYDADGFIMGYNNVSRLYFDDKPITFNKLEKAISLIKKVINENEFWTKTNGDEKLDEARKTIYNHIMKLRDAEITTASNIKNDEVSTLEVHKTDMNNVSHSLFLGNHGACCTAVGTGCNQFAAPRYVMDKCISAIEVMDGKDFVGNTMCYFAEVDGQLAFVLDNIELNNKYQFNDKIRDTFMDYAKQVCEEVGKPDIPIYAGPYRHKFNMTPYQTDKHSIKIIGSTDGENTYIDFEGHYVIDGKKTSITNLFKIR